MNTRNLDVQARAHVPTLYSRSISYRPSRSPLCDGNMGDGSVGRGDPFWQEDTEFAEGDAGVFIWRLRRSRSWGRIVLSTHRREGRTFRDRIYKAHRCYAMTRRRMVYDFGGIIRRNR